MKKFLYPFILFLLVGIFFWQFLIKGLIPVPTDTIVGLYYPFRDYFAKDYPNGVPFKNYLITDPVRQQYLWKDLSIQTEKQLQLPIWNPYTFAGQPLLANFQTGAFYPLNLIFFILPFVLAWSIFIFLQPLLASIFMYLYLDNLRLKKYASLLGGITFAFSGFSIAWLEWGNVIHTALWLPLILLSIDKIIRRPMTQDLRPRMLWNLLLIVSLASSFLAGHLQVFSYIFLVSLIYFLLRWYKTGKNINKLINFIFLLAVFFILILIQLIPTLNFILLSARNIDQNYLTIAGWFLPWQNLVQFLVPDFFGNPATLNYWGIWNYGEFVGYIGIGAFMLSVLSLFRKDKKTLFYLSLLLLSLIFALPDILSKLPFEFSLPFISTAQPTRLIFIADFSLSVLAALGFDYLLELKNKRRILHMLLIVSLIFISIWVTLFIYKNNFGSNWLVTRQNLILPTSLFILNSILFLVFFFLKDKKIYKILSIILVSLLFFDLVRFGWKFTPFTNRAYLYPETKILSYLQQNAGMYRVMSTDPKILPPNFSIKYKLQVLDGYDPLYLNAYAQFASAINRNKPNVSAPFGFNRIITVENPGSEFVNLLGVKYILSFDNVKSNDYPKIMSEGVTNLYLNRNVLPRVFFAKNLIKVNSNQEAIDNLYKVKDNLKNDVVIEGYKGSKTIYNNDSSKALINNYAENSVTINTQNSNDGFLVLTDNFYPNWHVTIDGKESRIYKTDYNLRGVFVPKGNHTIKFYISLL